MHPLSPFLRRQRRPVLTLVVLTLAMSVCAVHARADNDEAPARRHHYVVPSQGAWVKSRADYKMPTVTLVGADGAKAEFPQAIDDGKPVMIDFIYTTCTAICPVMSQTFAEVQKRLGDERSKLNMVSFSIDPEEDTPARLRDYARRYDAGPQWQFYTGTLEASIAVQKAFDAFRGDKMNHEPVILMRRAPGESWIRLQGFATPDDVIREYRQLVAAK
jgi:protein SCO1/2